MRMAHQLDAPAQHDNLQVPILIERTALEDSAVSALNIELAPDALYFIL